MSTDPREERLARRIADLYATDPQFAAAGPIEAVIAAVERPGLRSAAGRPHRHGGLRGAAGARPARCRVRHRPGDRPHDCRTAAPVRDRHVPPVVGPRRRRRRRLARRRPVRPGDRVCCAGLHQRGLHDDRQALARLGAVCVPLQTSAPVSQLRPIVAETEPTYSLRASTISTTPSNWC